MATTQIAIPDVYCCGYQLDPAETALGRMDSPCSAGSSVEELRRHMAEDGYLLLRNALDRSEVEAARRCILEQLQTSGQLDPAAPLMSGTPHPGSKLFFQPELAQKNNPPLQKLLYHPEGRLMRFFKHFLGGEVRHFDFTWLRCMAPGPATPGHCDIVYMGRGTRKLYTAWVPLGDASFEMGGLMVLENSHKNQRLQSTYGQRDVDSYCENRPEDKARTAYGTNGWLAKDANKLRHSLGGRWLTAEYAMGDLVVFGMDLVHGGTDNQTNRLRISSDSRYQLASEPIDPRWVGENPPGHGVVGKQGRIC